MVNPFQIDQFDEVFANRTSPEEWQRIISFRRHPNFIAALKTYHALMPQYFSDNLMLNKVVTEAWRFEILVYALYLYDQRDHANPRSGLTTSNLQRLCAQQKCASPGRVLAILGIMRVGGFLRQKKLDADSRIKHYEPTEKFVGIVEGWNQRIFQIIDSVQGNDHLAADHRSLPRFGWDMRKRGAESLFAGWKLLAPFPETDHFISRDGGWMLLLHCVGEALGPSNGKAIAPVAVDLKSFGKRFSVSRSHLRRLLESAHENQLLQEPPRNGSNIVLSPITVASFLSCMASELGFYQGHALAGREDARQSAQISC